MTKIPCLFKIYLELFEALESDTYFFFLFFYFYFFTRRPGSVIVRDQWTWEEEMAPNFKYLKVPPIYQKIKTSSFGPFFRSLAHNIYIIVVTSFINIYIYICIDLILYLALTQTRFSVTDSIYIFFLLNWQFFLWKLNSISTSVEASKIYPRMMKKTLKKIILCCFFEVDKHLPRFISGANVILCSVKHLGA